MLSKIAYIDKNPNSSPRSHQHGIAGSNIKFFFRFESIEDEVNQFNPDIVFINKGDFPVNFARIVNNRISVYWYGDWRVPTPDFVFNLAKICNISLFNAYNKYLWSQLHSMGQQNVFHIHQGANTDVFKPLGYGNSNIKYDIAFGGNYFGSTFPGSEFRLNTIRYLKGMGYKIIVVGSGWPEDVGTIERQPHGLLNKIYNQSKITLGISHFTDVDFSTSNRLYQCMAVGVPHVCWDAPRVCELFDDSYIGVNSLDELTEWLDYLLENKKKRIEIGAAQRTQILQRHTLSHAWQRIENIIKGIYPEIK